MLSDWCWRRLLRALESKEIKPVNFKGTQPWILIGRTDAEAPILWLPDAKWANSLEKTLMLGKAEGRRREWQRMRWLDGITDFGHELGQTPGDGERQGSLDCCSPWGLKKSNMTCWLNNNSKVRHVYSLPLKARSNWQKEHLGNSGVSFCLFFFSVTVYFSKNHM